MVLTVLTAVLQEKNNTGGKKQKTLTLKVRQVSPGAKSIDLMVTHSPVKLVLKQTLILKSATINIYLCSAMRLTDLESRTGN